MCCHVCLLHLLVRQILGCTYVFLNLQKNPPQPQTPNPSQETRVSFMDTKYRWFYSTLYKKNESGFLV